MTEADTWARNLAGMGVLKMRMFLPQVVREWGVTEMFQQVMYSFSDHSRMFVHDDGYIYTDNGVRQVHG